jgi:hypothetical protein
MRSGYLFLLLFSLYNNAQELSNTPDEAVPDIEIFEEINEAVGLVVAVEDESQLIDQVITIENNYSQPKEKKDCKVKDKLGGNGEEESTPEFDYIILVEEKKMRPTFYMQVIMGVEEARNTGVDSFNHMQNRDDLKNVIQAQNESDRNTAIKQLCNGKDPMTRIGYASTLFSELNNVYNDDMTGGRGDPFSDQDPTKNPGETQKITTQRQYNALNASLYGEDFLNVGGVCRHAASLVSDFLKQCGFDEEVISGLSYRTDEDSGHAIVKVTDKESGKTYTLNWGEATESEVGDLLANYQLTSENLPNTGMFVMLTEGNEAGKMDGFVRTNPGVVVSRLLGTADGDFDVTSYNYTEAGSELLLKNKKVKWASGKEREFYHGVVLKVAEAKRDNIIGNSDYMKGISSGYQIGFKKKTANGTLWGLNGSTGIAYFTSEEHLNRFKPWGDPSDISLDRKGMGLMGNVGGYIGKEIKNDNSTTTIKLSSNVIGEYYRYKIDQNGDDMGGNDDGNFYSINKLEVEHKTNSFYAKASGEMVVGVWDDMASNEVKDIKNVNLYTDRKRATFLVGAYDNNSNEYGANVKVTSMIDRTQYVGRANYKNKKLNLNTDAGFMVIKDRADNMQKYIIMSVRKEVNIKNTKVDASFSARKNISLDIPVVYEASIAIRPWYR